MCVGFEVIPTTQGIREQVRLTQGEPPRDSVVVAAVPGLYLQRCDPNLIATTAILHPLNNDLRPSFASKALGGTLRSQQKLTLFHLLTSLSAIWLHLMISGRVMKERKLFRCHYFRALELEPSTGTRIGPLCR